MIYRAEPGPESTRTNFTVPSKAQNLPAEQRYKRWDQNVSEQFIEPKQKQLRSS